MDFEKLFEAIGISEPGRKVFYKLHERMTDAVFFDSYMKSLEEYEKGDAEFGECIAEFAERENVSVEELNLYIYLRKCEATVATYLKKGIDLNIFYLTMSEFVAACESNYKKNGIYGIPQRVFRRWLRRPIDCKIFNLGILRFEIAASRYDVEIDGIKVNKGDEIISVHIPKGSLDETECEAAYELARDFFARYFGMKPPVFFCYSWLIQPWLADALAEESRIVKFQSKYRIIDFVEDPGDVLRWVYPKICENVEEYPEGTTIQRAIKERLLNSEIIGYGAGVRL